MATDNLPVKLGRRGSRRAPQDYHERLARLLGSRQTLGEVVVNPTVGGGQPAVRGTRTIGRCSLERQKSEQSCE